MSALVICKQREATPDTKCPYQYRVSLIKQTKPNLCKFHEMKRMYIGKNITYHSAAYDTY